VRTARGVDLHAAGESTGFGSEGWGESLPPLLLLRGKNDWKKKRCTLSIGGHTRRKRPFLNSKRLVKKKKKGTSQGMGSVLLLQGERRAHRPHGKNGTKRKKNLFQPTRETTLYGERYLYSSKEERGFAIGELTLKELLRGFSLWD